MLGATDDVTAEYFSARSGDMTVEVNSTMTTRQSLALAQVIPQYRYTEGIGRRRVLTPDEVLRLPNDELLIILRGQKVLRAKKFDFTEHPYTDVLLKELSTGNLKKAYLITAFALRPKLLLLDEPVNGLDFQSTEFLYQLMGGYQQYGTLLFSSHILESICLTSDRVLVLEQGRIGRTFTGTEIAAGKIREVLADEEHH